MLTPMAGSTLLQSHFVQVVAATTSVKFDIVKKEMRRPPRAPAWCESFGDVDVFFLCCEVHVEATPRFL